MLVRILYLNVVSKLIFLTIVLLNNLTKKIKDFEIHYSGFCRIRMIKIDLSIIFQVICGLITVMNNVNVHIFNTFSVLFYSKHAYVNRTKKNNCITCAFFHAHNEHIPTRREYLKCNDILKQPPPPFDASSTL